MPCIIPHIITQKDYELCTYQKDTKNMKMEYESHKKQNRRNSRRLASCNNLQHEPDQRKNSNNISTPIEAFSIFIPYSLQETVAEYVNGNIECFHKQFPFVKENPKQMAYSNFIDIVEIKAFLGIIYLRSSMKQDLLSC